MAAILPECERVVSLKKHLKFSLTNCILIEMHKKDSLGNIHILRYTFLRTFLPPHDGITLRPNVILFWQWFQNYVLWENG